MRTNKIIFILGTRGTGKSYYTINKLIKKVNKKVLIVDTLDHPAYRKEGYKIIPVESLNRWQSGVYRIITNPVRIAQDVAFMNEYLSNCLIIFEDATKYLRTNTPQSVFQFIYDTKQRNIDVIFQYHGFKKILPELLDNANYFTIFKLTENINNYKEKIPDFEKVLAISNKVNAAANPYENITIEVN